MLRRAAREGVLVKLLVSHSEKVEKTPDLNNLELSIGTF